MREEAHILLISPFICNVPIFTIQVPQDNLSTGGQVYTVATQFSSSQSGYITQLGFYRASGETGTNTLRLWTERLRAEAKDKFPAKVTAFRPEKNKLQAERTGALREQPWADHLAAAKEAGGGSSARTAYIRPGHESLPE